MRACARRSVRRVASVGWAVRTSSSETSPSRALQLVGGRRRQGASKASSSDSRGARASCAYSRRRRSRWCCSAVFASWKYRAKARSMLATAPRRRASARPRGRPPGRRSRASAARWREPAPRRAGSPRLPVRRARARGASRGGARPAEAARRAPPAGACCSRTHPPSSPLERAHRIASGLPPGNMILCPVAWRRQAVLLHNDVSTELSSP